MEGTQRPHGLTIEGRARARLTGILAVSSFNEEEIVLETPLGELALLGDGMHIEQLNLENGELGIAGDIAAAEYSELRPKKGRRLFGRKREK